MAKLKKKKNIGSFFSNYKKSIFYGLVVLCVGLAGYFIVFSKAAVDVNTNAPAAPALYITPRSQTLGANETFTVQIRTNSGTTSVNAVQANVSYPTALVDFVSLEVSSSAYTVQAQNDTATPGLLKIGRGEQAGLTGDKLVAVATFKTKATSGDITLDFDTGSRVLKSSDNTDLLSAGDLYSASYTIDTTNPSVALTSPSNGAVLEYKNNHSITASASDGGSGLDRVEFYVDGALVNTDTSSPYAYNWSTNGLDHDTTHTIYSIAYDRVGNSSTSSTSTVTIKDTVEPIVTSVSPQNGATLDGTISLSANASDVGTGIDRVRFWIVTDSIANDPMIEDSTSPYEVSFDTTTIEDGTYELRVTAIDKAGNWSSNTSPIIITIDNSDKIAPTQPGNFVSSNVGEKSLSLSWGASTDNIGVVSYELKRGSTVLQNTTSRTFNDSGLQPSTAYNYSVVAIDAAGNRSTAATLSVTTLNPVPGDTNGDRIVDIIDLSRLLSAWGTQNGFNADFNSDNIVDIVDLSILLSNWTQ